MNISFCISPRLFALATHHAYYTKHARLFESMAAQSTSPRERKLQAKFSAEAAYYQEKASEAGISMMRLLSPMLRHAPKA